MLTKFLSATEGQWPSLWLGSDVGVCDPFVVALVASHTRAGVPVHLASLVPLPIALASALSRHSSHLLQLHVLSAAASCAGSCRPPLLSPASSQLVEQHFAQLVARVAAATEPCLLLLLGVDALLCWRPLHWLCRQLRPLLLTTGPTRSSHSAAPAITSSVSGNAERQSTVSRPRAARLCLTACEDVLSGSNGLAALQHYVHNVARVGRLCATEAGVVTADAPLTLSVTMETRSCPAGRRQLVTVDTASLTVTPVADTQQSAGHPTSTVHSGSAGPAQSNSDQQQQHRQLQQLATFSVQLSSEERQARERVELPYMKSQHVPADGAAVAQQATVAVGGGRVFYQPDVEDDWDDEDPDDDLDI